jgi:GMP synthase-like glutamine amidotransferase
MKFLIINMYNDQLKYKKFKKKLIDILQGKKLIFKRWDDNKDIYDTLKNNKIAGIIISGSDYFVKEKKHSIIDEIIIKSKIPILAICYGFQYIITKFGKQSFIKTQASGYMKYSAKFSITKLFNIPKNKYYLFHKDYIVKVPKTFKVIKKIKNKIIMAYNHKRNILGVQFHPEKYKKSGKIFFNTWINKCVLF